MKSLIDIRAKASTTEKLLAVKQHRAVEDTSTLSPGLAELVYKVALGYINRQPGELGAVFGILNPSMLSNERFQADPIRNIGVLELDDNVLQALSEVAKVYTQGRCTSGKQYIEKIMEELVLLSVRQAVVSSKSFEVILMRQLNKNTGSVLKTTVDPETDLNALLDGTVLSNVVSARKSYVISRLKQRISTDTGNELYLSTVTLKRLYSDFDKLVGEPADISSRVIDRAYVEYKKLYISVVEDRLKNSNNVERKELEGYIKKLTRG